MFLIDVMRRLASQTRTCPKCGDTVYVNSADKDKSVTCEKCGAKAPPPKVQT